MEIFHFSNQKSPDLGINSTWQSCDSKFCKYAPKEQVQVINTKTIALHVRLVFFSMFVLFVLYTKARFPYNRRCRRKTCLTQKYFSSDASDAVFPMIAYELGSNKNYSKCRCMRTNDFGLWLTYC